MRYQVAFLAVLLLAGCESKAEKDQKESNKRIAAENEAFLKGADTVKLNARDSTLEPSNAPPLAVNPCARPRPYKNWSNAELNAAQVRYIGKPESQGLIDEAACRLR